MDKIAYGAIAAIGIAAIAIVVVFIGPSFNRLFISESPRPNAESMTPALELSLDNVNIYKTSDNTATVQVNFAAHNAGKNTAILQTVQYNVLVNGTKIASGAIGKQSEDVISGQANVYPVLANDTMHVKDTQSFSKSAVGSSIWDVITNGKASYLVRGIYLFRDNTNLQAEGLVKDFELTYPPQTMAAIPPNNLNNASANTTLKHAQTIALP